MRVGLVCPYSWDVPGGVQSHVRDLARVLRERGHSVAVLAPGERPTHPDDDVETVGRAVAVPYNGSVARLAFGPRVAARTKRWLREREFDLVHVHEPSTPSLSLLALWASEQPVVATFHTATRPSRAMASVASLVRPSMEKISARIAVSEAARDTLVKHVSGEPVVIPNGVDHEALSRAAVNEEWRRPGPTIAFLGRVDEPRKGFAIALEAFELMRRRRPNARLIVAGPVGDPDRIVPGGLRDSVQMLGVVSDVDRARLLRSCDVFIAPNTYGESFGIVVLEAMAAGAAVVASDLPAFRGILGSRGAGLLFPVGDASAAAGLIDALLGDDSARSELGARAMLEAKRYDWTQVIVDIEGVYKAVLPPWEPVVSWAVVALVVIGLLALATAGWCVWTATRLDRLHLKVEVADASLRESLQRRSSLAIELASTGLTDPASAVLLMSAAVEARDNGVDWLAQSQLTYTLRLVDSSGDGQLASDVRASQREASIARRIRNDLVARTVDLRGRRRVRWFRLAGGAAPPLMVEYDDADV